jgi:hypothetical protein
VASFAAEDRISLTPLPVIIPVSFASPPLVPHLYLMAGSTFKSFRPLADYFDEAVHYLVKKLPAQKGVSAARLESTMREQASQLLFGVIFFKGSDEVPALEQGPNNLGGASLEALPNGSGASGLETVSGAAGVECGGGTVRHRSKMDQSTGFEAGGRVRLPVPPDEERVSKAGKRALSDAAFGSERKQSNGVRAVERAGRSISEQSAETGRSMSRNLVLLDHVAAGESVGKQSQERSTDSDAQKPGRWESSKAAAEPASRGGLLETAQKPGQSGKRSGSTHSTLAEPGPSSGRSTPEPHEGTGRPILEEEHKLPWLFKNRVALSDSSKPDQRTDSKEEPVMYEDDTWGPLPERAVPLQMESSNHSLSWGHKTPAQEPPEEEQLEVILGLRQPTGGRQGVDDSAAFPPENTNQGVPSTLQATGVTLLDLEQAVPLVQAPASPPFEQATASPPFQQALLFQAPPSPRLKHDPDINGKQTPGKKKTRPRKMGEV